MTSTQFIEFTEWTHVKEIALHADSTTTFVWVCRNTTDVDLKFVTQGDNAHVEWYILCLATKENTIKCSTFWDLHHNKCSANLHIVTLYWDWWNAHIDGWVNIHPGIVKAEWHLLEENIIVWEWVTIKTLPMLDVRSNDVKASHWARIEKLNAIKQFYLESKWLPKEQAKKLMIWWYIESLLSHINDEEKVKSLKEEYLWILL